VTVGSAVPSAGRRTDRTGTLGRWLRRPLIAAAVLLVAYIALSFAMSPRGYLGTDTGGKVATLEVMAHHGGGLDPGVGYWAAKWDPSGSDHGLYYTFRVGNRYLNVTTLPMLYAALPLYELGGYRLALLIPMLGGVACAFAARALARRFGAATGWAAFWLVGLASPVTIYSLDLWEHSWGLALMAWGVVALLDAVALRPTWWRGLLAGAAFGLAALLRDEAFVYVLVATAVTCVALARSDRGVRSGVRSALVVGASAVAGFGLLLAANAGLEETLLGSTIRAARATGTAGGTASSLHVRLDEAITMAGGLLGSTATSSIVVVAGLIGLLAFVAHRAARGGDQRPAQIAAGLVVVLFVVRVVVGLGFIPGLVATTPFAAAGLVLAWKDRSARLAALVALLALPIVWLTDFTGGVIPQWGGRYILTSGLLLGVIGIARTESVARWARQLFVALAVAVTLFGLVFMSQRTHQVADAGSWIASRPEPVVVSAVPFWLRESGSLEPDHRWLSVDSRPGLNRAARIVTDAGFDRFGLITDTPGKPPLKIPGFHPVSRVNRDWLSDHFQYTVYARDGT
jgi:hypothetical protein